MNSSQSFAALNITPSFSHSMRRALHLARNSSRVIGHLDGCWLGSDLGFNELELTLTFSASTRDKRTTRSRGSCTFGKSLIQKRVALWIRRVLVRSQEGQLKRRPSAAAFRCPSRASALAALRARSQFWAPC